MKVGNKMIKRSFEMLISDSNWPIGSSQMSRFEVMLSKFSRIPFRPLDIFNVCFETGVSILSLLISYVLVLLQFKVAESKSYHK